MAPKGCRKRRIEKIWQPEVCFSDGGLENSTLDGQKSK